jgi:Zn-dependent protease
MGELPMQLDTVTSIFALLVLFFSVIIHEVAHGYAALWLGDPTAKLQGRLTLNPISHIDPVGTIFVPLALILSGSPMRFGWAKPVPYNSANLNNSAFARRWGEAIVKGAGVATNLLLAIVFAFIARMAHAGGQDAFASLSALIVLTNLSLGLFNLIPIPPLDGYGFFTGLLPYRYAYSLRRFEERVWQGGALSLILVLLFMYYVVSGPFSDVIFAVYTFLMGG